MSDSIMVRAALTCKEELIGLYECPLVQNHQIFSLFSSSRYDMSVDTLLEHAHLLIEMQFSHDSAWVQLYEGRLLVPTFENDCDDLEFIHKQLGATELEDLRICPLMPVNTLCEGKMQLLFEATQRDDNTDNVRNAGDERPLQQDEVRFLLRIFRTPCDTG